MIYLNYLLLIIVGWVGSLITGGILAPIFQSNKSKIGGFLSGLIIPQITVFAITKLLVDKNSKGIYDILPVSLILIPLVLFNLQALYNSRLQVWKQNELLPVTGIKMKINVGLVIGSLIGSIVALIIFTNYNFN